MLGFVVFGYIIFSAHLLPYREGIRNRTDITIESAGVYLVLVAVKASRWRGLAAVAEIFRQYLILGQHFPVWLGRHQGFSLERILS